MSNAMSGSAVQIKPITEAELIRFGLTHEQVLALNRHVPLDYIENRPGPNNQSIPYIQGWYVAKVANDIFGPGNWSRECVSKEIVFAGEDKKAIWDKNAKTYKEIDVFRVIVIYTMRVKVRTPSGQWIEREGSDAGSGEADIPRGDKKLAYANALKEAETDAQKRAFVTFGNAFGLHLYDKKAEDRPRGQGPGIPERPLERAQGPITGTYAAPVNTVGTNAERPSESTTAKLVELPTSQAPVQMQTLPPEGPAAPAPGSMTAPEPQPAPPAPTRAAELPPIVETTTPESNSTPADAAPTAAPSPASATAEVMPAKSEPSAAASQQDSPPARRTPVRGALPPEAALFEETFNIEPFRARYNFISDGRDPPEIKRIKVEDFAKKADGTMGEITLKVRTDFMAKLVEAFDNKNVTDPAIPYATILAHASELKRIHGASNEDRKLIARLVGRACRAIDERSSR